MQISRYIVAVTSEHSKNIPQKYSLLTSKEIKGGHWFGGILFGILCFMFIKRRLLKEHANKNAHIKQTLISLLVLRYHWQELPQVYFWHIFCSDKSMLAMTKLVVTKLCLSQQNIFVATNICHDKHVFVTTKALSQQMMCFTCLSWQKYVCCDKTFVTTELCLSQQIFVMTKLFVMTTNIILLPQNFGHITSILLSQQNMCFAATNKSVVTKLLLWQKLYL